MRGIANRPSWATEDPLRGVRWGRSGRYVIDRRLGTGGMGTVYAATDTVLGRLVALKIMNAGDSDDGSQAPRMLREARLAAQVEHERIARVYDVDDHEGSLFVAMEFVRGTTLRARMAAGDLDAGEFVGIAVQIAEGLAELHARGLVHRDLKPENVMLTQAGGVKLLDFGLAREIARGESSERSLLAALHAPAGTPGYMAPERFEGGLLDYRVDVFALGVIVYELVARRRPFCDVSRIAAQGGAREAPDFAGPRWSRMSHLRGVTARMLAHDPRHRLVDGSRALAALQEVAFRASGAYVRTTAEPSSSGPLLPRGEATDRNLETLDVADRPPEARLAPDGWRRPLAAGSLVLLGAVIIAVLAAETAIVPAEPDARSPLRRPRPDPRAIRIEWRRMPIRPGPRPTSRRPACS